MPSPPGSYMGEVAFKNCDCEIQTYRQLLELNGSPVNRVPNMGISSAAGPVKILCAGLIEEGERVLETWRCMFALRL